MSACHQIDDIVKMKRNTMKKTLLALLSATLLFSVITPAQAEDQKVLAIIDSAINSNNFPSIIQEACFTTVKSADPKQNMSCPNGELFMEGKGSATAPWPASINNGTYHGDSMVKAALTVDPNLKIVFVRVYNVNSIGNSSTPSDGSTILEALKWVNNNASRYSIDAVSISQSGVKKNLSGVVLGPHYACSDAFILNPFGNAGEIVKVAVPPVFCGVMAVKLLLGVPV